MNLKLEAKYLQLEKSRNKLLNDLSKLEDQALNYPPENGKWSVMQVVAHLVLVDEVTISYIKRKLQQPGQLRPSSFRNSLNAILLKFALKSWFKFKSPSVVATVPDTAILEELRRKWDSLRFELEDILADLPEENMNKCLFRHPVAGPLSITQTLHFLQDHFDHHLQQINQLRKQLPVGELQKEKQLRQ